MGRRNKKWFRRDIGWWMVTIDGRKIRLAKGEENEAEAERAFHELMAFRPRRPEADDSRVCDVVEAFLQYAKKRCAADTYRNYHFYGNSFAKARGYMLARDVVPGDVTEWVDSKPWNETSEYNGRRVVHRVFSWAKGEGYLRTNPLQGMPRGRPNRRERCLTVQEYCSLLRTARRPFRVFLWALKQTGARPSELRRLTWDQVHGDRLVIAKHKTAKKTGKPRVVFLSERMQRRLEQLRRRSHSRYVFVNSRGQPWTANAVRLQVARIRKRCGLAKDVCAYLVRHTFGTWAIMNGVDTASVAALMGHTSTEMVVKVYSHIAGQHSFMRDAAERACQRPARSKLPEAEQRPNG